MPRPAGTDLHVSELCLGGNVFGWTADEATSFALLDRYVDATPSTVRRFVDTAESYGDGTSRRILGDWLASRPITAVARRRLAEQQTVVAPIASARNVEQLADLLPMQDLVLADDERQVLDDASAA